MSNAVKGNLTFGPLLLFFFMFFVSNKEKRKPTTEAPDQYVKSVQS